MHRGYVKLWRKIEESSFYKNSNCVHLALHLTMHANYKETKFLFNKQEIILQKGQLICGRVKLSEETGLTQRNVRTCLDTLTNVGFLTIKTTNKFSIITICKYEDYQSQEEKNDQHIDQQVTNKRPASDQQVTTSKELIRTIKTKEYIYIDDFESLWTKYPNKDGKKQALKHFTSTVKSEQDLKDIQTALNNYLSSKKVVEGFVKNGSTWFNNWRDWINYSNPEINVTKNKFLESLED